MIEQKAKYEEIVDWIKEKIDSGKLTDGQKLYSEAALADKFDVSRQTARHAVSILERQGIVRRKRGSGSYMQLSDMGENTAYTRSMRVAILTTYVDEYIFPGMLREMEKVFSEKRYSIQIAATNNAVEKERMLLKGFLGPGQVDGIIAEPTKSGLPNPNLSLYREIMKRGIPVIFINSCYPELNAPHISVNDEKAGYMVTKHLIECGHQKIAGIFKCDDGQGHRRYAGYMKALMEADIRIVGRRVLWIDTDEQKDMKNDPLRILERIKECSACVCYNDEVANKLIGICTEQGIKIPEDLSIAGIDNSDLAVYCEVPFTSVENPKEQLAKLAAEELIDLMNGKKSAGSYELEPELVIRNSVKLINHI